MVLLIVSYVVASVHLTGPSASSNTVMTVLNPCFDMFISILQDQSNRWIRSKTGSNSRCVLFCAFRNKHRNSQLRYVIVRFYGTVVFYGSSPTLERMSLSALYWATTECGSARSIKNSRLRYIIFTLLWYIYQFTNLLLPVFNFSRISRCKSCFLMKRGAIFRKCIVRCSATDPDLGFNDTANEYLVYTLNDSVAM